MTTPQEILDEIIDNVIKVELAYSYDEDAKYNYPEREAIFFKGLEQLRPYLKSELDTAKIELADYVLKNIGKITYSYSKDISYYVPEIQGTLITELITKIKELEQK
jgi:hypothetical protein